MKAHLKIMNHLALPTKTSSLNFEPVTPMPGNEKRLLDAFQENSTTAISSSQGRTCFKIQLSSRLRIMARKLTGSTGFSTINIHSSDMPLK